jgi:hypothetical protein
MEINSEIQPPPPRILYYPLNRRLGEPLVLPEIRPQFLDHPAHYNDCTILICKNVCVASDMMFGKFKNY